MAHVIDEGAEPDVSQFRREMERALLKAGHILREGFVERPAQKPGAKHLGGPLTGGFYTLRQRAFVIGGVRAGTLKVPYKRTANLERSWSVVLTKVAGDPAVDVFSDPSEAPYNVYVQSDAKRVEMHSDWPTPDSVAKSKGSEALEVVCSVAKRWGFS